MVAVTRAEREGVGRRRYRLAGGLLILTACGAADTADRPEGREAASSSPDSALVDFAALVPGDSVQGLRVDSIDIRPDPVDSFGWMGSVDFSGEVVLSGEFQPHFDFPELAETCFFVDDSVAGRLPRFPNDVRRPWFCFSNQDRSAELLGEPGATGRARIHIDRYHYLYQHTDVYNRARLTAVEGVQ